ncbi:Non-reducing end alpha-L-arabinofuranosidase BoGH43A [Paramyrothecium foliicola]|nr:Non-reducing end alpha-L-arabinofuranosidase BoGH43A [Paramyrothecium foliicola]
MERENISTTWGRAPWAPTSAAAHWKVWLHRIIPINFAIKFVQVYRLTRKCSNDGYKGGDSDAITSCLQDVLNMLYLSRPRGHVLSRRDQLPELAETNRSTSGIWAPTIRQHGNDLWVVTTLVNDDLPQEDPKRWSNIIFRGKNNLRDLDWSDAIHFEFEGYDTSPFWDVGDEAYVVAAHAWRVSPGIDLAKVNLQTGEVEKWERIWNGTGGKAPEGPHLYRKDGWYYLLAAEGGTGVEHMVTIARSKNLFGPYESNPANPILSSFNTTEYFQTVGHADLVSDDRGNWWCFALSTRSGPDYEYYPMGRETVLAPASWPKNAWPVVDQIRGEMVGWPSPKRGKGHKIQGRWSGDDDAINFTPSSSWPLHFTHWRYPIEGTYDISPKEHPDSLRLKSSVLNLTALNGNYAGPSGQTFVSRRQEHTLFSFSVVIDFDPTKEEEEAGVSTFLTQNHHLDLGVVLLPDAAQKLVKHFRFRGISYDEVPAPLIVPVPEKWSDEPLRLGITAANMTHFWFSAGPARRQSETQTFMIASNHVVSWGFTGVLLGVYATTNGGDGQMPVYVSEWTYKALEQYRT